MKKIGVLTSGGDCAGLNAVLRAITLRAIYGYNCKVYGIKHGTLGLLERPVDAIELKPETFSKDIARLGGTILGTTNKGNPFHFPMPDGSFQDRSKEIRAGIQELGLDGLIGVGGDGSLAILSKLFSQHTPFIGIPKTIDNDIITTERSIGFSTAVDIATEALDRLQPTAASHDRVMVLEVMGRDAGHIALSAGIAGGADVILIPEIPYRFDIIEQKIKESFKTGQNFALVIVAEAVRTENGARAHLKDPNTGRERYGGIGHYFSEELSKRLGAETRFMVLGHVQRGASPNSLDRVLANAFGVHAVDLLAQGAKNRVVSWLNRVVTDVPLEEAISVCGTVDPQDTLVKTAKGLGISFGDEKTL